MQATVPKSPTMTYSTISDASTQTIEAEHIASKKRKLNSTEGHYSLAEFESLCTRISQIKSFEGRWEEFTRLFIDRTYRGEPVSLSLEEMRCTLQLAPFASRVFSEEFLLGHYRNFRITKMFFLHLYETNTCFNPILEFSLSQDGRVGELAWLEKGLHISGTTVIDIFKKFEKALRVKTIYLYENAEINIGKRDHLRLRLIYPIADQDGLPWYQKALQFTPLARENLLLLGEENSITQSPETYKPAIRFIKSLTLENLEELGGYREQKPLLTMLRKQHSKDLTIHKLVKSLKDSRDTETLYRFQKSFLTHYQPSAKASDLEKLYCNALYILETTCIFTKTNSSLSS